MATNWLDVWQSLSRRELFRKTGVATGVMLLLGSLIDKASAQPVPPAPALAGANDYFLKLDGIEGESYDKMHPREIDVVSFSWAASQTGTAALGGGGMAGKVQMQDMKFVMRVNKASPRLMLACATGQHIKGAILSVRKAGQGQQDYLKWTLTDVLVSSYQTGGGQGTIPADQVGLDFARIDVVYQEQMPDGRLGLPTKSAYDVKANKAM